MNENKQRLINPILGWFLFSTILANIAVRMYQPILPLYLQHLGASVNQVGVFYTVAFLIPLCFQILGGWVSDSMGRLQAIAVGSILGVIGNFMLLWAPTWEWMLLAFGISSTASSFVAPSFQALIAEQSSRENFGKIFGISEGLFSVVGVIGPVLGGYISDHHGYKLLFSITAIIYFSAAIIRCIMARKAGSQRSTSQPKFNFSGLKSSFRNIFSLLFMGGVITWIFITDGVRDVSYSLIGNLQPIYLQSQVHLSNTQIGFLVSLSSLVVMALMAAAGWLSDKKGERVGIVSGFAFNAMGILSIIVFRNFTSCIVGFIFHGIGDALLTPAYNSLISKVIPPNLRGVAFGLFSTSLGLISLPAPYLGSLLYSYVSPGMPFIIPVAAMIALLPIAWVKFRLPKENGPAPVSSEDA